MSGALLSRFDLVFILLDKPDEEMDRFLSEHIMKMHTGNQRRGDRGSGSSAGNQGPLGGRQSHRRSQMSGGPGNRLGGMENDGEIPSLSDRLKLRPGEMLDPMPPVFLRKYIAYAKKYVHPRLSKEAAEILQGFYLKLRREYRSMDAIPITTRQLESMVRLTEAKARSELRENVTVQDALEVIEIMKFSLWATYQDDFGQVDFERSQNGAGMSRRGDPKRFISELTKISHQTANNRFTYDMLYSIAKDRHFEVQSFQDFIDSLNNQGYLLKKGPKVWQLSTMG